MQPADGDRDSNMTDTLQIKSLDLWGSAGPTEPQAGWVKIKSSYRGRKHKEGIREEEQNMETSQQKKLN